MGEAGSLEPVQIVTMEGFHVSSQEHHGHDHLSKSSQSSILTRLHAGYFRMSMSLGAQALLWKNLSEEAGIPNSQTTLSNAFRFLSSTASLLLWILSLLTLFSLSLLYLFRCFFHFHMVKAEFRHHIGMNFIFAPWISWLLLLQSAPLIVAEALSYQVLCWVFTVPILMLDIKIYGEWFTTEKRFLSLVANPTSQMSVIGNLVAAQAVARMGWKECAVSIFSLGMAHYLILFVTLYQRLSGGNRFPAMLRPAFFSFIAAPSLGSLAWSSISGSFCIPSKMLFFLSSFLFISLVCRPALFKKSMKRFYVAWWGYSFPLTFLALASSEYAEEVKGREAPLLVLVLSVFSVLVFLGLMLLTALNVDRLFRQNDPILCFSADKEPPTPVTTSLVD